MIFKEKVNKIHAIKILNSFHELDIELEDVVAELA